MVATKAQTTVRINGCAAWMGLIGPQVSMRHMTLPVVVTTIATLLALSSLLSSKPRFLSSALARPAESASIRIGAVRDVRRREDSP